MTFRQPHERELRVLVLAPFGRDGQLTCEVLHGAGIDSLRCEDMGQLCAALREGAGCIIVAAEALHPASVPALAGALGEQAPWSDIPLVLATTSHQARAAREWTLQALKRAGHIALLERPIRVQTLVSVVHSALTTRRRQYEMRDLIEKLRVGVERLDAERVVRERFVNLLAHDLRGPLGVSKMNAQMLAARPELREQTSALAGRIEKSIERAETMIRDLLDAHRLRAGHRLPLKLKRCDLMEIVRDATEDLPASDRARLVVQGPAHLEGQWDPDLLRRALWNLVTNAVKYGATDTPISVTTGHSQTVAWTAVHNWGASISQEEQQHLFEPFTRTHGTEAGTQRGWGLGLTLVQGVAVSHGGTVEVSSQPESGTAFTLRIPLAPRPQLPEK
jgi:signal transduction histidine kinase